MSTVKTNAIETQAGGTSVLTLGTSTQTLKILGGAPGASKVLTSDATGGATWLAPAAAGDDAVKVLSKAGDYIILPADVSGVGTLYVLVDASVTSRTITLPTAANYSGVVINVVTTVAPGTNTVTVNNAVGGEVWTMYALNDFYEVISDGTNDKKIAGQATIYGYIITVTSGGYSGIGGTVNMFDSSSSVQNNIGGFWDSTTDYRVEIPSYFGTGLITMGSVLLGNGSISAAYWKNGSAYYSPVAGEYAGSGGRQIISPCVASDTFSHMVKGTHTAVNYLFYGGGPPADATYGWFRIERYT